MWKIHAGPVHRLYSVTDIFIRDILHWACTNSSVNENNLLDSISNMKLKVVARRSPKFRKQLFKLFKSNTAKELLDVYDYLSSHYDLVLKGSSKMPKLNEAALTAAHTLFDYLYNEFLDNKIFWKVYNSGVMNSKAEYRDAIGKTRRICPYCDLNRIIISESSNTDHFLPLSQNPLLGVFWKNLIVSCLPCNQLLKGAKEVQLPILQPYNDQPADHFRFVFDINNQKVIIEIIDSDKSRVENYLNLFNINRVYSEIWADIEVEERILLRCMKRMIKAKQTTHRKEIKSILMEEIIERRNEIQNQVRITELTKLKLDFFDSLEREVDTMLDFFVLENKSSSVYVG